MKYVKDQFIHPIMFILINILTAFIRTTYCICSHLSIVTGCDYSSSPLSTGARTHNCLAQLGGQLLLDYFHSQVN